MKRVVISFCLLSAIVIYSFTGTFFIRKENNRLISLLDEIQVCYESKDINGALIKANELDKEWELYERKMSMIVRDEKLNNLGMAVARITPYISNENEEFNAELKNIYHQIYMIYHSEFPAWHKIL